MAMSPPLTLPGWGECWITPTKRAATARAASPGRGCVLHIHTVHVYLYLWLYMRLTLHSLLPSAALSRPTS